jgi:hypothetical protein
MPDEIDAGVELKGLAEANRDMERWARELGPAVAAGLQGFARTIAGQVQGEVPVLTGTLAASVEVVDTGEGDELGLGIGIGDGVPYAGWIEFGGSRGRALIPEGRYLYPAAADAEPDFTQIASDIAEDTARSFPWSTPAL